MMNGELLLPPPIGYTMPVSRHADIDTIDDFMRTAARMKSGNGEN